MWQEDGTAFGAEEVGAQGDRPRAPSGETSPGAPADPLEDGAFRALDPRYVPATRASNAILFAVVAAGGAVGGTAALLAVDWPVPARIAAGVGFLALFAAFAWVSWAWPALEYARTKWRLDRTGIEIRRGVLWRHLIAVPRRRIQHTDVAQGPLQRRFGLATLVIHTAGTQSYEVNLRGLAHETALRVRDLLLRESGQDED